jgi:hypothetical protein
MSWKGALPVEIKTAFALVDPDRLQARMGASLLTLLGLPLVALGLPLVLVAAGLLNPRHGEALGEWSRILVFLLGLACSGTGTALVLGRRRITLDRARGVVVQEWSSLLRLFRREGSLREYDAVRIDIQAGSPEGASRYLVYLQGRDGRSSLDLSGPKGYGDAREQAVALARFLRMPLVDASTEQESFTPVSLLFQM